eukprot:COSAG06_NODE_4396_length_4300_cov_24.967151_6_plen_80_part_00
MELPSPPLDFGGASPSRPVSPGGAEAARGGGGARLAGGGGGGGAGRLGVPSAVPSELGMVSPHSLSQTQGRPFHRRMYD